MQATLYNYADVTPVAEYFKELHALGYFDGCKADLLKLLWDLKPHGLDEVKAVGQSQYNARIHELRKEGWDIVSIRFSNSPNATGYLLRDQVRRLKSFV